MASKNTGNSAAKSVKVATPVVVSAEVKSPVAATSLVAPDATSVVAPAVVAAAPAAVVAAAPAVVRDRTGVVALIAKLRDADAEAARDAAVTLGTLPTDAEAVNALCAVVKNADGYFHPVVRAAAAAALGKLGDVRAVEALIAGTGDTMAEASEEAVKALGLLKDKRAAAVLQAIVANPRGFYLEMVRKTAAESLKQLNT